MAVTLEQCIERARREEREEVRKQRPELLRMLGRAYHVAASSETRLYAGLLARALCRADPELAAKFGEGVAEATGVSI